MPRKILLFACVLFLWFALKYAFGQDENATVGWDPDVYEDPAQSIFALMIGAPILGAIFGAVRVLRQHSARPLLEPIRLK